MKKCCSCKLPKDEEEFNVNKSRKDGRSSLCRLCDNIASRERYAKNVARHQDYVNSKRKKLIPVHRKIVLEYLMSHPCIDCGEADIVCLHFDHVRGDKIKSISQMLRGNHSTNTLLKEMSKCDIRCANCHMKKTAKDFD
jgi:hypothetical protein